MKNKFLAALAFIVFATALPHHAAAQTQSGWQPSSGHTQIPIWPKGAPGAKINLPAEVDATNSKDNLIAGKPLIRLYAEGGHGYGLRPANLPVTHWPKLVETWLHTIHVLEVPPSAQ